MSRTAILPTRPNPRFNTCWARRIIIKVVKGVNNEKPTRTMNTPLKVIAKFQLGIIRIPPSTKIRVPMMLTQVSAMRVFSSIWLRRSAFAGETCVASYEGMSAANIEANSPIRLLLINTYQVISIVRTLVTKKTSLIVRDIISTVP